MHAMAVLEVLRDAKNIDVKKSETSTTYIK
jgi:hypothetical protein